MGVQVIEVPAAYPREVKTSIPAYKFVPVVLVVLLVFGWVPTLVAMSMESYFEAYDDNSSSRVTGGLFQFTYCNSSYYNYKPCSSYSYSSATPNLQLASGLTITFLLVSFLVSILGGGLILLRTFFTCTQRWEVADALLSPVRIGNILSMILWLVPLYLYPVLVGSIASQLSIGGLNFEDGRIYLSWGFYQTITTAFITSIVVGCYEFVYNMEKRDRAANSYQVLPHVEEGTPLTTMSTASAANVSGVSKKPSLRLALTLIFHLFCFIFVIYALSTFMWMQSITYLTTQPYTMPGSYYDSNNTVIYQQIVGIGVVSFKACAWPLPSVNSTSPYDIEYNCVYRSFYDLSDSSWDPVAMSRDEAKELENSGVGVIDMLVIGLVFMICASGMTLARLVGQCLASVGVNRPAVLRKGLVQASTILSVIALLLWLGVFPVYTFSNSALLQGGAFSFSNSFFTVVPSVVLLAMAVICLICEWQEQSNQE